MLDQSSRALALAICCSSLANAGFSPGDLVLLTTSAGTQPTTQAAAILIKTSPLSVSLIATGSGMIGDGAFDSYRNRIAVPCNDAFGRRLYLLDSDGSFTLLPYSGNTDITAVAPAGDGRIYLQRTAKFSYIDAAGVTHDVLNTFGPNAYIPPRAWNRMYFDAGTHSLFLGGSSSINALITKIPLTADGARVAGPPVDTIFVTANLSSPTVVGLSPGPNGTVFIKLDDNSNNTAPRLLLMDAATTDVTVYANSGYFGVAGEVAGCYSPALNAAVVLDSLNDRLRVFTLNTVGEGAASNILQLVSSAGGSGEHATMFPITAAASNCPGDINHDAQVDDADFTLFVQAYNLLDCADPAMTSGCPADFNHDGFVDDSDFIVFVAAYNALVCP